MGGRAARPHMCRTPGVRAGDGQAIKVRNARETVMWCDARVPDRLP